MGESKRRQQDKKRLATALAGPIIAEYPDFILGDIHVVYDKHGARIEILFRGIATVAIPFHGEIVVPNLGIFDSYRVRIKQDIIKYLVIHRLTGS